MSRPADHVPGPHSRLAQPVLERLRRRRQAGCLCLPSPAQFLRAFRRNHHARRQRLKRRKHRCGGGPGDCADGSESEGPGSGAARRRSPLGWAGVAAAAFGPGRFWRKLWGHGQHRPAEQHAAWREQRLPGEACDAEVVGGPSAARQRNAELRPRVRHDCPRRLGKIAMPSRSI